MQTPVHPLSVTPVFALAVVAALALGTAPADAARPPAVQWSQAQIVSADLQFQHLAPGLYRQSFQASATVQNPSTLLRDLSAVDVARAQRTAALSRLRLAQLQAQRAQGLYRSGQNIALAEVQQAQGAAQTARAQVDVAQATLQAAQAELTASLGPALAARLQTAPALRSAIASGRELIVDLTLPPGADLPAAAQVRLHVPGGSGELHDGWLPATVIGPAAAASAHVQGLRFVATSPAASGLMPGLQVPAQVQAGRARHGVLLPASAVVWSGGQALVFTALPTAGNTRQFTPRAVSTAWPLQAGYMQPGWAALDVVTHGAGLLLTPPPKPQARPAAPSTTAGDDD